MINISGISKGLEIKKGIVIGWKSSIEETKKLFTDNDINYEIELNNNYYCIKTTQEFVDFGVLTIGYHFVNNVLKQVSLSNNSRKEFDITNFEQINDILKKHLGWASCCKKNKYLWKFERIILNHYYEDIDGILIEYLNINIKK